LSTRILGNLAGVAAMIVWTTGLPAAAHVLQTWHPLLVLPVRMALAGLILMVMVPILEEVPRISRRMWLDIAICGAALGVSGLGIVWGQRYADPVNVAIVSAAIPAISAAIGWLTGKERLTVTIVIGIVLSFGGGLLCMFGEPAANGLADRGITLGLGEFLAFAGNALFVVFAMLANERLSGLSDLARSATTLSASAVVILPITILVGVTGIADLTYTMDWQTLGLLAWLGCVSIGISTLFWMMACRMLGVTTAAMHNNLIPFYAMLFALMLGNAVSALQVVGSMMVICGAVLAQTTFRWARFKPK
jgi:drug/metabolite transporter (DMT)-like permease